MAMSTKELRDFGLHRCDQDCARPHAEPSPPTVTVPREQAERTLRVLTDREWSATDDGEAWCWTDCLEYKSDGHAPDCELAASIADWRAVLG